MWSGQRLAAVQDKCGQRYGSAAVKTAAASPSEAEVCSYLISISSATTCVPSYDVKTLSLTVGTSTTHGKLFDVRSLIIHKKSPRGQKHRKLYCDVYCDLQDTVAALESLGLEAGYRVGIVGTLPS